jgi:hypothetical protein
VLTEHDAIVIRSRQDANKVIHILDHGMERDGSISPDGRWLLYSSISAAHRDVFVRSMPKEAGGAARPRSASGKFPWQGEANPRGVEMGRRFSSLHPMV